MNNKGLLGRISLFSIALLLLCFLFVFIMPVRADPDFSGCDINITNASIPYIIYQNDTVYCLNETIDVSDINGIDFSTNIHNSTLDCLGYTMANHLGISNYAIYLKTNSTTNTVRNCNISYFGEGIVVYNSSDNNLVNNIIQTIGSSIEISSYSYNNNLINNTIFGDSTGISLYLSSYNNLNNNTVNMTHYNGITMTSSPNNNLTNNTIIVPHIPSFKGSGLQISGNTLQYFAENIEESNTINGLPIYYIDGTNRPCTNNTIYSNGSSYSSMGFVGCDNITVQYSSPIDHLLLAGTTNSTINGLNISYTVKAIFITANSNNNTIINNTLNSNFDGITLSNSTNTTIINNIIDSNEHGFYTASESNFNTLINNTINSNYIAVNIFYSHNNTLINNTIDSNYYGISFSGCYNNTITGGSVSNSSNSDYYLALASSYYDNKFTNTNFTSARTVYFGTDEDSFNYRNDSSGNVWLKTYVSAAATLLRKLINWNQTLMQWNDTNITGPNITTTYNITGLLGSTTYDIYNNSVLVQTLATDASGNLPSFTIYLDSEHEIKVEQHNPIIYNVSVDQSVGVILFSPPAYPIWLNNTTSVASGSQYLPGVNYTFNITWAGVIDIVFFESNYTNNSAQAGNMTNYTNPDVTNSSGVFSIVLRDLPAQTFVYRWIANDTASYLNSTPFLNFTINKGTLNLSIEASPSASVDYPTETTVTGTENNNGDSDVTYELWRDDTLVDSSSPYQKVETLEAGSYVYRFNSNGGANWTADPIGVTLTLTVTGTSFVPGGGSGSIPVVTKVTREEGKVNVSLETIKANGTANITILKTEEMAIRKLSINVLKQVNNVKIIITKISAMPATVSHGINGEVYHYINIEKENINDTDINKTIIRFAVNKTWISDNNINITNISMYRWEGYKWNELPTNNVSEDAFEIYYEAVSPGFSVFTIGTSGGTTEIAEEGCVERWSCTEWSVCSNSTQTRTCTDSNSCGTVVDKPLESQECQASIIPELPPIEELPITTIVAVAMLVVVAVGSMIFLKSKGKLSFLSKEKEGEEEKEYYY